MPLNHSKTRRTSLAHVQCGKFRMSAWKLAPESCTCVQGLVGWRSLIVSSEGTDLACSEIEIPHATAKGVENEIESIDKSSHRFDGCGRGLSPRSQEKRFGVE